MPSTSGWISCEKCDAAKYAMTKSICGFHLALHVHLCSNKLWYAAQGATICLESALAFSFLWHTAWHRSVQLCSTVYCTVRSTQHSHTNAV